MTGSIRGYLLAEKSTSYAAIAMMAVEIPASLVYPFVWLYIIDSVIAGGNLDGLLPATAIWVGVQTVEQLIRAGRTYTTEPLGASFARDARSALHSRIIHLPWTRLETAQTGDLTARFGPDTDVVERFIARDLPALIVQISSFVLVIAALVWINAILATVVVIPVIIVAYVVRRFNARMAPRYAESANRYGATSASFEEDVSGVRALQALGAERSRHDRLQADMDQLFQLRMRIVLGKIYSENVSGFIAFLGTAAMVTLGGVLIVNDQMTVGGLVAFLGFAWRLPFAVNVAMTAADTWNRSKAASNRLREYLAPDAASPGALITAPVGLVKASKEGKGEIDFDVRRFTYPSRSEPALAGVGFTGGPGDVICLVGSSGAGKSTVLSLLAGFYYPTDGAIAIDGEPLTAGNSRQARASMAIVLQDAFLWNGTVADNICMGNMDATPKQIEDAARRANAHEFVASLPMGYETTIGERGIRLSGGQRQRIAVARAFLRQPRIILMDEPTSSVERESEGIVLDALQNLSRGRTTVIASHRRAFAEVANEVILLDSGATVCAGTFQQLVQDSPQFRSLMGASKAASVMNISRNWCFLDTPPLDASCSASTAQACYATAFMNILKSKRDRLWSFQNVIVVSGGKGGVGKSTLALNLACALGKNGLSVGLLDLDVSGPDLPWMTGARYKGATAGVALNWPIYEKEFSVESMIQPLRRWGVSLASIGFFVGENDAVTLAGEVMQTVVRQLEYQVNWGDLDVLIVDSPPGTGPVPQAAISELKPTGALIVVTPQDIAALDAGRAMALHENKNIPVLGVIRNMTTMLCDHCGSELHLFHDGKNAEYANDSIRILGDLPFDPSVSEAGDIGVPMVFHKPDSPWAERVTEIAGLIVPEAATD